MIYLYIKESPLGLKYLGKTTANDPFSYMGSGTYWLKHIKKHKFTKEDIKTIILLETSDTEELKRVGIYYSELWDIVNSKDFANLTIECGDGGQTMTSELLSIKAKERWSDPIYREKMSSMRKGRSVWNSSKTNVYSDDTLNKMRDKKIGISLTAEHKEKIKAGNLNRIYSTFKCIETNETFNSANAVIRFLQNIKGSYKIKMMKSGESLKIKNYTFLKI